MTTLKINTTVVCYLCDRQLFHTVHSVPHFSWLTIDNYRVRIEWKD